jgi:hypothetical protein
MKSNRREGAEEQKYTGVKEISPDFLPRKKTPLSQRKAFHNVIY